MSACWRLRSAGGRPVQPGDFLAREEAREFRAPVAPDAPCRVLLDIPPRDRDVYDLAEERDALVGAAGRRAAVGVEPLPHLRRGDVIERLRSEGRQYPSFEHVPHGPSGWPACSGGNAPPSIRLRRNPATAGRHAPECGPPPSRVWPGAHDTPAALPPPPTSRPARAKSASCVLRSPPAERRSSRRSGARGPRGRARICPRRYIPARRGGAARWRRQDAGVRMAEVVNADVLDPRLGADIPPEAVEPIRVSGPAAARRGKHPPAGPWQPVEDYPRGLRQPDGAGSRLGVRGGTDGLRGSRTGAAPASRSCGNRSAGARGRRRPRKTDVPPVRTAPPTACGFPRRTGTARGPSGGIA